MIDNLRVLERTEQEKGIEVDDVRYLGKAVIMHELDGQEVQTEINAYAVLEGKTIKYYFDNVCVAYETVNVGNSEPAIIPSPEYLRMYEKGTPIKDIIENLKHRVREEQSKPKEDKEYVSLREFEDEDKNKKLEAKQTEKRKPSYVIEKVKPDVAKMDYWQTIKQAFGLPEEVDTLAFAYPVSTEEKVNHADITIYMLDKDGYIIDDLNINDYFEFDSSTGNNPISDEVVRHEEDENKGKAQTEGNRTMVRLKAKQSSDNNTYISLEQKDGLEDSNDISAGRKVFCGTQNVEKQLETDRIMVWDSEREKLMSEYRGQFNMNEIFEEAAMHKEHRDDEYVPTKNADGDENTLEVCNNSIIPGTDMTWEELSESTGRGIKDLQKEFR